MSRARVNPLASTTDLQPQANPVNSFVAPQQPSQTTGFQELAQGLGRFSDKLSNMAAQDKAEQSRLEVQKLHALAVKNNQLGIGVQDAIKTGTIPSDKLDTYTFYANSLYGHRVAIEHQEQVLKDLNDPSSEYFTTNDIEGLLADKRQSFFQNLDPVSAEGAADEWGRTEATILEARRKVSADNLINSVQQSYAVWSRDLIRKGIELGTAPDKIIGDIQNNVSLLSTAIHGVPNSDKNKMLFTEATTLANEYADRGEFDKAEQALNVLTSPRFDAQNPTQPVPPVATGELLSRVEGMRSTINTQRSRALAQQFEQQQEDAVNLKVSRMAEAGQLFNVQDETVNKADGDTKTISRTSLIDTAVNGYLQQSAKIAEQRNETPEQRIQREANWFSIQGVPNPVWKATLQNGIKSYTTSSTDNGIAPDNAVNAFRLYRTLSQTSPLYLSSLLDDTSRQFLETADMANKYLSQDENQALMTAFRATSNPAMRGRSVSVGKVEAALTASASLTGRNTGTLTGATIQLANTLLAAGFSEDDAIAKAVERTRKSTVIVNGWSVYSNNAVMPNDFKTRAERILGDVWSSHAKDLEAAGYSKDSLQVVNSTLADSNWLIQTPLAQVIGKFGIKELIAQQQMDSAQSLDAAVAAGNSRKKPITSGRTFVGQ